MADADWDAEDFEPQEAAAAPPVKTDKWAGEDVEEDIKDNWDDEEEEEEKKEDGQVVAVQKKKKKSLAERIKEKEEKRKKELEEKKQKEKEAQAKLTPEEMCAEKLRQQRIQEESDLELAKDAFGVTSNDVLAKPTIDSFVPVSIEDFETFESMLKEKITKYESSVNYPGFLEMLFRDLVTGLESDDIKKLGSTLNAVANEKQKQQKSTKGKKKKKGPNLKEGGELEAYDDVYDDVYDFM